MEICFASGNENKVSEIRAKVPSHIKILGLREIGCHEEIPETGCTLRENALLKASHVWNNYGLACFADDTGLEVEALGGAPGVYSARYAGPDCNALDNMARLLDELSGSPNRRAAFRTVICLLSEKGPVYFEGKVEGEIMESYLGDAGFGYDPLFRPSGYDITFAQMDVHEKNRISHRGLALEKLFSHLGDTGLKKNE